MIWMQMPRQLLGLVLQIPSLVAISFRGSKQLWRKYFGHDGHLSIHGSHFYHGFYVRQLLEILLQTYQAYHISRSVPRLWINRFVVTMIVINCVYAPLVNLVFKTSPAWRRAMNLTIDVLIDFAIAVIVPLCVFLPRVYQMNWPTPEFPAELIYNDAWLAGALSEARQIMLSLGTHGFLGIHGRQFYAGFYARQAIEIMLQTYQAYQISNSVSDLAINRWAIPPVIKEFRNLNHFEIFNCTMVDWDSEASLMSQNSPRFTSMAFFISNLTSFPTGLLHSEIPTNMGLTIYGCNISELPREVGDVWAAHKWPYLWLDYNHLRSLPSSFSKMRLRRLSLTYNRFQLLDDDMFANFEFYRLRLTGNPLLHPS
ncbi:hypothetical protein ATCC90586_004582 [Pythium insidiosum]|nr:hypothetical protein ATCC90586_004582 [Pythium insidiosum]